MILVVAVVAAFNLEDWHWQLGTVGEWVAGLATVTAVFVALWLPHRERRLEQRRREWESRAKDLDETRRVAIMLRLRPRNFFLGENFGQIAAVATVLNAVEHHSGLLTRPQVLDLADRIISSTATKDLDELIDELTRRLTDLEARPPT